jgi:type IV secretion system protein VirB4
VAPDRYARRFQPQIGHWDREIGINQDGSVFAIRHLTGHDADLAGVRTTVGLHLGANALARGLSDPRVEMWHHLIRQDGQSMSPLPPIDNWFGARFDEGLPGDAGRRHALSERPVRHGGHAPARRAAERDAGAFRRRAVRASAGGRRVARRLRGGAADARRRAGPVWGPAARAARAGGVVFSELAEALHLIGNGHFRPIGLTAGRMGRMAMPERVVFGLRDFEIVKEGEPRFGAVLSIKDYPPRTSPVMFDAIRRLPFGLVLTNAERFQQKADALGKIGLRVKQMQSGNDAAKSQVAELAQDEDDVMSGRSVYVRHHFGLAVYAPSIDVLDRRVAQAQSALSDVGITSVRETDALAAAVAGQLPGNSRWWPRPAMTKSINAVGMAAKHDVPRGQYHGRWGAPVLLLRTTADTEYAFHFQVQGSAQIPAEDLANCLVFGPAGSGKTGLLGSVSLLALRNPATRVVVVDKDYGLSVMVRAAGGSYLVLPSGSPSGLAPLHGLTAGPDDMAFLERFVRGLILADGQGELSADEDQRLQRAVARQMEMPPEMRGLAGVAVMLGQRAKDGAAARLRKWCRGERLGWAFDNEARPAADGRAHDRLRHDGAAARRTGLLADALLSVLPDAQADRRAADRAGGRRVLADGPGAGLPRREQRPPQDDPQERGRGDPRDAEPARCAEQRQRPHLQAAGSDQDILRRRERRAG